MTISNITPQSQEPYYDDWTEEKNYNQILFRPGVAVQIRELNQIQTTLQSQLDYLGQYTFADGAVVLDGNITTFSRDYIKFVGSTPVSAADVGLVWTDVNFTPDSDLQFHILSVASSAETGAYDTAFGNYTNGGNSTYSVYPSDTYIQKVGFAGAGHRVNTSANTPTGKASFATIEEGIYFFGGYFIYVEAQTIVLEYYNDTPSYEIGFIVDITNIVTASEDPSLADNSLGMPNSSAPGANRLSMAATIHKIALDPVTGDYVDTADIPANWIPHTRVINGATVANLADDNSDTGLSARLERRTYEESGDYTIGGFDVAVREDKLVVDEDGYSNDGRAADGDVDKFVIDVDASVAYIQGRRVDKGKLLNAVTVDKPRATTGVQNAVKQYARKSFGVVEGSYFIVNNVEGIPRPNVMGSRSDNTIYDSSNAEVGTCLIKTIEEDSETGHYRVYVFDVKLLAGKSISEAFSISDKQTTGAGLPDSPDVWYGKIAQGLTNTESNSSLAKLPIKNAKQIADYSSGNAVDNTKYFVRMTLVSGSVDVGANTASFNIPGGLKLAQTTNIFSSGNDGSDWSPMVAATTTSSIGETGSIVVSVDASTTGTAVCSVILENRSSRNFKPKTLNKYEQDTGITYSSATSTYELAYADATNLHLIFERIGSVANKTVDGQVTDSTVVTVNSASSITAGDLVTSSGYIERPIYVISRNGNDITLSHKVTLPDNVSITFQTIIDHTDKFTFDSGCRDAYYDLASITLVHGVSPTAISNGSLYVIFDYFGRSSSGDYFSVDSYADYDNIPSYNGVSLRDVLDFRPTHQPRGSGANLPSSSGGAHQSIYPAIGLAITLEEPQVYMGRKDKLYLDNNGDYIYRAGIPNIRPQPSSNVPPASILLFDIDVNPYVYNIKTDVSFSMINNEGYTMEEIRGLEQNIEQLQYQVASAQSANSSSADMIANRIENGFAVDDFSSITEGLSDVSHPDYSVAMANGDTLVPSFTESSVNLVLSESDAGTATVSSHGIATVPYTEVGSIIQHWGSQDKSINANGIANYLSGAIVTSPVSDNWMSDNSEPVPANNGWVEYTAQLEYNGRPTLYRYGYYGWQLWAKSLQQYRVNSITREVQTRSQNGGSWTTLAVSTGDDLNKITVASWRRRIWWSSSRAYNVNITPKFADNGSAGTVPKMRAREVYFKANTLKPNTTVYAFLNGHDVSAYVKEATAAEYAANLAGVKTDASAAIITYPGHFGIDGGATALSSDESGTIYGVLLIPNNRTISIPAGEATLVLTDSSTNASTRSTAAEVSFLSGQNVKSTERAVKLNDTSKFDNVYNENDLNDFENWNDGAIAQVINVPQKGTGLFAKSLTCYFTTKDVALPVHVKLVRLRGNGMPSRNAIPGSMVSLLPADVNADAGGDLQTVFTFDYPVFLEAGESYALWLYSNSGVYALRVTQAGKEYPNGQGNGRAYRQDESVGPLLVRSSAKDWSVQTGIATKFKITRCKFITGNTYTVNLVNDQVDSVLLPPNPFFFESQDGSDATITVTHPNHGMYGSGHTVVLSNCVATNNLTAAELNDVAGFAVTNATKNTYTITVPYAGSDPVTSISAGGDTVSAFGNIMYDMIKPSIDVVEPANTDILIDMLGTEGESADSTGLSFTRDAAATTENNEAFTIVDVPHVVLSAANQTIGTPALSGKSLRSTVTLSTSDDRMSPQVNLESSHMITHAHDINSPTGGVADTEATNTSTVAKYITRKLELNKASSAIDLYMNISRPAGSDVEVYYKTTNDEFDNGTEDGENIDWNDIGWTLIDNNPAASPKSTIEPPVIPVTGEFTGDDEEGVFNEIHYNVLDSNGELSFTAFAIKIVMKSTDSSSVPAIKNLRVFASTAAS